MTNLIYNRAVNGGRVTVSDSVSWVIYYLEGLIPYRFTKSTSLGI